MIAETLEEDSAIVERICRAVKDNPEFGKEEIYEQIAAHEAGAAEN